MEQCTRRPCTAGTDTRRWYFIYSLHVLATVVPTGYRNQTRRRAMPDSRLAKRPGLVACNDGFAGDWNDTADGISVNNEIGRAVFVD